MAVDPTALEEILRTGPAQIDLPIYQGASFTMPISWHTEDEAGERNPVDLSGCSVRMQFRRRVNSPAVELDLGAASYIRITDPLQGEMLIDLPPAVTAALAFRSGVHDIEVEFSGGEVLRFAKGIVVVDREVTR
ncbi:hypothetical protein SAMN05216198_2081 [Halopseudomonas litoralis]|uniref:Uncharacterized protein n=1 Tax=Halopseudomonas litoralis TaxID=797277 RepID=A0A1H1SPD9_9GAMM|nr:hypothetical protein [Halopseudomonas litoralis]SDS49606.1 hypothetical protein SAMN05216198_2081 [Halopseudomonas litoralis]